MRCPKCSYDLNGCSSNQCPECGASIAVVVRSSLKMPKVLYIGMGLIILFALASTLDLWSDYGMFNAIVFNYGSADPAELAGYARFNMIIKYATRITLGAGIIFITVGLYQMLNQVIAQLANKAKEA